MRRRKKDQRKKAAMPTEKTPEPDIKIRIRSVWKHNLVSEFRLIRQCLRRFRFATFDTEFPGTIYDSAKPFHQRTATDRYAVLKANVDSLNLIQFGLTLSDSKGNLPDLGSPGSVRYVWEFNFRDFNVYRDPYAVDSIQLLKSNGIDFDRNIVYGVDSRDFTEQLMLSGLVLSKGRAVKWVTFHGAYDFAYLIKILTRRSLPCTLGEFMNMVSFFFGKKSFMDMKHMIKYCDGLFGGLERVASALQVGRVAGKCHQAGSDSLLTCQAFLKLRKQFFLKDGGSKHAGVLFGMEVC